MNKKIICDSVIRVPKEIISSYDYSCIKNELTYKITNYISNRHFSRDKFIEDFSETCDIINLPRYYGLKKFKNKFDIINNTVLGNKIDIDFKYEEEEKSINKNPFIKDIVKIQSKAVDKFISKLKNQSFCNHGIFVGFCGIGKTIMAFKIMSKLKRPCIVIVNETGVMNQWINKALKFLKINKDDIGIIRGKKCEYENKKISFAMVQTLMNRVHSYDVNFYNHFGCVMFDEAHHAGALRFSKAVKHIPAKIRIGFTATPRAKHWDITKNNWGEVLVKIKPNEAEIQNKFNENSKIAYIDGSDAREKAYVYLVSTDFNLSKFEEKKCFMKRIKKPNFSRIINLLVKDKKRNQKILKYIIRAVKDERKILVLSSRINHLKYLKEEFGKYCEDNNLKKTFGLYIGKMDKEEINKTKTCDVIFGISRKAAEGMDIPNLDTLIMTTPSTSDVEQSVGRIQRTGGNNNKRVVIDFVDNKMYYTNSIERVYMLYRMCMKRIKSYFNCGCIFEIKYNNKKYKCSKYKQQAVYWYYFRNKFGKGRV